jgi:hypothetical protein
VTSCSAPGCSSPPVIQWRQLLDDAAVDSHLAALHRRAAAQAEEQRLTVRIRIAALETAIANPPKTLSPDDLRRFQERGRAQIEAAQKEHDAIPLTFDLEHHRAGSYRALGHCEEHQHGDLDWYAVAHAPTCSGEKECGCS